MVKTNKLKAWLYKKADFSISVISFAIALVTFFNEIKQDTQWISDYPRLWNITEWLQGYSIYFYSLLFISLFIFTIVKKTKNPWSWRQVQFILDEYQDKVFNELDDPSDYNRITLFQMKKNCFIRRHWSSNTKFKPSGKHPFFSDYLVPVLRSGHMSKKTNALFYIGDKSDECEGIAGQAWCAQNMVVAVNLPEVKGRTSTEIKKSYSEATYTDMKLIEKYTTQGRVPPRSMAALPVEVNGEPWGVIVLDSRRPDGVSGQSVQNYTLTVSMIGRLLEAA